MAKTAICGHFGLAQISWNGQIYNFGSEYARDFILVSIPRFWGMGNSLGSFSDTSYWPKWPKRPFVAILVSQNKLEWPNLYLWALVLNMLETRFWCLSLGFGPWENHWDHFQTPQISLSGQIPIFGHMRYDGQTSNFIAEHARNLILVSIPKFIGIGNPFWATE